MNKLSKLHITGEPPHKGTGMWEVFLCCDVLKILTCPPWESSQPIPTPWHEWTHLLILTRDTPDMTPIIWRLLITTCTFPITDSIYGIITLSHTCTTDRFLNNIPCFPCFFTCLFHVHIHTIMSHYWLHKTSQSHITLSNNFWHLQHWYPSHI